MEMGNKIYKGQENFDSGKVEKKKLTDIGFDMWLSKDHWKFFTGR